MGGGFQSRKKTATSFAGLLWVCPKGRGKRRGEWKRENSFNSKKGFETRDGGRDILAVNKTSLGEHLFLVECKRHAPERPIGVSSKFSLSKNS